jgi:hypothetical protein
VSVNYSLFYNENTVQVQGYLVSAPE